MAYTATLGSQQDLEHLGMCAANHLIHGSLPVVSSLLQHGMH